MNLMPVISIIIPVYNTKSFYLKKCFDSIINQSYRDFEVLIIDSSTNNETTQLISTFLSIDNRFRLIRSEKGVSKQRNLGIDNSKGTFIAFIDSDDRISDDYLQVLLNALNDSKSDIAFPQLIKEKYCGDKIVESSALNYKKLDKFIDKNCFFEETPENGLVNPIKLYRKDLIGDTRFNEKLSYGEDMMFNYELSKKGFNAEQCVEALYYFSADINVNSASKRLDKTSLNIIPTLFDIYRNEKKITSKTNLQGVLYQFNYCFEIFFRACVLKHKTFYLIWLIRYRFFYLSHNKVNCKQRLFIMFPYLRALSKKIIGSK